MEDEFQRRLPSTEKAIAELRPEDIRVRIMGMVVDRQEDRLVIDDGTGRVTVSSDKPGLELDQFVRIFGRVIPVENGLEIQGEIIQDMSRLDLESFKRYKKIEK